MSECAAAVDCPVVAENEDAEGARTSDGRLLRPSYASPVGENLWGSMNGRREPQLQSLS